MARLLENLEPGTPVRAEDGTLVGEVRGVYSMGESRVPEFLSVFWLDRGEEALLPTDEVIAIDESGVLLRASRAAYTDLIAFDPRRNPLLRRLH